MIDYQVLQNGSLIWATPHDILSIDHVISYIKAIYSDKKLQRDYYEVVDFSYIKDIKLSYYDLKTLSEAASAINNQRKILGIYHYVVSPDAKAISKLFQTLMSMEGVSVSQVENKDNLLEIFPLTEEEQNLLFSQAI